MSIINNQYHPICRPSTSITRQSLRLKAAILLSVISSGIVFHSSAIASFKESKLVVLRLWYTFRSRSPQIPKSSGFKFGLFGGQ